MKAVVFTLGCKVNGCESGSLMEGLVRLGYEVSDELGPADVYILNTCAVTAEAEKKSRQAVARVKKLNPDAKIYVCGCASERAPAAFMEKENVVLVTGARQKGKLLSLLGQEGTFIDDNDREYDDLLPPKCLKSRRFVKIQDGCNNFCSYCIIPYLRGRSRSRSLESAAAEILSADAEEVVITGIDISSYNDKGRGLAALLRAVKDAKCRIRLGSLEVGAVTEELLSASKEVASFAPHFHLSLQSGAESVLRKMNRHYTKEQYEERVRMIREIFPDAAVTTDIIVGFPTETEEDFSETLAFAEKIGFSQIHCFPYSRRTGTVAAKWKEVPPEIKSQRLHKLLALAGTLRKEYEERYIGKVLELVPEEISEGYTQGYSENYIRVYVEGALSEKTSVRAVSAYKDGILAVRE